MQITGKYLLVREVRATEPAQRKGGGLETQHPQP